MTDALNDLKDFVHKTKRKVLRKARGSALIADPKMVAAFKEWWSGAKDIDRIADETGIAKRLLYSRFRTIQSLLEVKGRKAR